MTILANEIHIGQTPQETVLVQVADRRLTANGKFHSCGRKIFRLSNLRASIGYFGLAQRNGREFFCSWIPNVLRNGSAIKTVSEFAAYFLTELNRTVDKQLLRTTPSGFHLCGFAPDGLPEFHFIRNIEHLQGPKYSGFSDHYRHSEDFRSRDSEKTPPGSTWIYVNGDLRHFWGFWAAAGSFVNAAAQDSVFSVPSSLGQRAKWKLEALASFYTAFAHQKIVGRPIDVIELTMGTTTPTSK